jgi:iron(III) transport system permease protein
MLTMARQAIAFLIGLPIAWIIARTNLPGRNWLEFGFWISFFLPVLPVTMGWVVLMDGKQGFLNQLLMKLPFVSGPPFEIFSWWGIVFAHLAGGTIAAKIMLLTPAFRNMDSSLEEASYACGANKLQTSFRVIFPLMAPAILMVMLLTTIRALESFEVELFLGGAANIDVYSTLIYRFIYSEHSQYGIAAALSMLILIVLIPFILLHQWLSLKDSHTTITGKYKASNKDLRKWKWPVFGLIAFLLTFTTLVPIVFTILGSVMRFFGMFSIPHPFTFSHWNKAFHNSVFMSSLANTLIIGISAALFGMILFSVIAYVSVRSKFIGRKILDYLTWLPTTIPGIVLGLGIFWIFLTTPGLKIFYGTHFILILAILLGSITLSVQLIKSNMVQLSSELEEAGWACGSSWWYTFRKIILPLVAPAIAVAGLYIFAAAARTASLVALLQTADTKPLSMLQLDYLGGGSFELGSVIGVVILCMTICVALLARILGLKIRGSSG